MIRLVLFDLDGTLVTFTLDVKNSKKEIINYLNINKIDIEPDKHLGFNHLFTLVKKKLEDRCDIEYQKVRNDLFQIMKTFEENASKTTELQDSCVEVLRDLVKRNVKIGLVTSNNKKTAHDILKKFDIYNFFDIIICREDTYRHKPDPTPLQKAIKGLNMKNEETIFIGDSVFDVNAAKNLGIPVIGIAKNESDITRLRKYKPEYLVENLKEVNEILKTLI